MKTLISIFVVIFAILGVAGWAIRKALIPVTLMATIYFIVWHVLPQLAALSQNV